MTIGKQFFNIVEVLDRCVYCEEEWRYPEARTKGGTDESEISVFNIIFESILFRFDLVLFNIISF